MTIAWLLDRYPSPTETFIARDLEALRERGFEVRIWALQAGENAQQIPNPTPGATLATSIGDVVARRRDERPRFWRARGSHLARICREELCEVEWIHAGWANYIAWMADGAARELGVPWSFSAHARDLLSMGGDVAAKLHAARFALVCNQTAARWLQQHAPADASKVISAPHGLRVAEFPFVAWEPPGDGVCQIFSVGRLVPKKGFDLLLAAIAQLRDDGLTLEARIVGEGPQRGELEAQIAALNLAGIVRLEGERPIAQIPALMEEATRAGSAFALPCRVANDGDSDGLPNVLLEAAASGLPLVAARAGSVGDFVDETTGWLCQPDDVTSLVEVLRDVWQNPAATRERCLTARHRVESERDIARTVEVLAQSFLAGRASEPGQRE